MFYIRNFKPYQEMLLIKLFRIGTTVSFICEVLRSWYNEKEVSFENLVSCGMVFHSWSEIYEIYYPLKNVCSSILTLHFIIYWHHLLTKNINTILHESLIIIIKTINEIKSHSNIRFI